MQLYLVRHAQSANNAQPEHLRVSDPGITEVGEQQAICLADWLDGNSFRHLLTSAFRRALQTATYIRRRTDHVPEVVVDVHEHGGCVDGWHDDNFVGRSGLNDDEVIAEFGEVKIETPIGADGWWKSKPREDYAQSRLRAQSVENYFRERLASQKETILCVTHADFLAMLLEEMFGDAIQEDSRFLDLKNTGVTHVEWVDEKWKIHTMNSVDHLPHELVTS